MLREKGSSEPEALSERKRFKRSPKKKGSPSIDGLPSQNENGKAALEDANFFVLDKFFVYLTNPFGQIHAVLPA